MVQNMNAMTLHRISFNILYEYVKTYNMEQNRSKVDNQSYMYLQLSAKFHRFKPAIYQQRDSNMEL